MTAKMDDDLYSESMKLLHPRLAQTKMINRIKQAKVLNDELADYFKELHSIQDYHIKSLIKLSKKIQIDQSHSQFKIDQDFIQSSDQYFKLLLHQELIQLIELHSNYQIQLHSNVEMSIRNSSFGINHQNKLKSLEDQLNRIIKSYEDAELKLNKSSSKLSNVNNLVSQSKKVQLLQAKQSEDQIAFNQSKQIWLNQSSQIFNSYQSIDRDRLIDLTETLTKFETLQNDHFRHQLEISEKTTISLVAFDILDEMNRFATLNRSIPSDSSITDHSPNQNQSLIHQQQDHVSKNHPTNTSPIKSTPTPHQPTQSIQNHSRQPTSSSQLPSQLSSRLPISLSELQSDKLTATQTPREEDPQQLNQSTSSSSPRPLDGTSSPSLRSSQLQSPIRTDLNSTYDPNHPEISQLIAPNISIPIRTTTSPTHPFSSSLPPRTLYVQSQKPASSPSNPIHDSNMKPTNHTSSPKAANHSSIAEKFFSKSRIVNILSRNGNNHQQNQNLKLSQERRSSQSNLPLEQLPQSRVDPHNSFSQSIDMSRPRRNSSVMENPQSDRLDTSETLTSSEASQTDPKSSWNASRFVPFLPGSNPLRNRKTSQSLHRMNSSSTRDLTRKNINLYAKVDSEGFTIPPENRDRTPWEQETDTEILSTEAANSSGHQPTASRNDTTTSHASLESDRQSLSGSGLNSFAIKPLGSTETPDSEAERLAAIQKVQNTLASSFGSPRRKLSTTHRSNNALRARRLEGRGITMYDASPISNLEPSTQPIRRGSFSERPNLGLAPTPGLISRSASDTINAQPPIASNPNILQLPSRRSSVDLQLGNDIQGRSSRCDSMDSSNFTSTGFQNIGPLLQVGGTGGSKNPFLKNTSLPSTPSNNPSAFSNYGLHASSTIDDKSQTLSSISPKLMIISEKLNVLMNQGSLIKLLVMGEVHVTRSLIHKIGTKSDKLYFKIRHSDRLEKVAFPHGLVSPSSSSRNQFPTTSSDHTNSNNNDNNQEYELDLARLNAILLPDQQKFCILKYRIYFDCSQTGIQASNMELAYRHLPVIFIPRWRTSKEKTELVLNYKLSPEFQKFQSDQKGEILSSHQYEQDSERNGEIKKFELSTVIYNPEIDRTHTKKITIISQQSLPLGDFDSSTNKMKWTLVDSDEEKQKGERNKLFEKLNGKIICRFFHDHGQREEIDKNQTINQEHDHNEMNKNENKQENNEFKIENCGPICVNWTIHDVNLTGIQVEIDQHHLEQYSPSGINSFIDQNKNNQDLVATAFCQDDHVEKIVQTSTFLVR